MKTEYSKITITATAKFLCIGQGTLSGLLSGKKDAGKHLARKLSQETKTKIEIWLFGDEEHLAERQRSINILQSSLKES